MDNVELNQQRRSLYVFPWQLLRVKLDFSSYASTVIAVETVVNYITRKDTVEVTTADMYKALNLFVATSVGLYGQLKLNAGKQDIIDDINKRITHIMSIREYFSKLYATRKQLRAAEWANEFPVDNCRRINELSLAAPDDLLMVYNDLHQRWLDVYARQPQIERNELYEYLDLMATVMAERNIKHKPLEGK